MARRSLKEAVQGSGLVENPELKAFVFGHTATETTTQTASETSAPISELQSVPRTSIHLTFSFTPDRQPVRYYYEKEELRQWAESDIAVNGIQSPLWVRPSTEGKPNEYELVAGLRRYLAAEILELEELPVIIRHWSDEEAFQASLSENANRRDFSPLEHLDGTLKLLAVKLDSTVEAAVKLLYRMNNEAKGTVNQNVLVNPEYESVKAVFGFLGQTTWQSFVSTRLPLLNKPDEILDAIRQGKIQYTKGLEIAKIKDVEQRQKLLQQAINENLSLNQIKEFTKLSKPIAENATVKNRFAETSKRVKAAKLWSDPKKVKRLEKLMIQLEELLQD